MPINNQRFVNENDGDPIELQVRVAKSIDAKAILGLIRQVSRETPYLNTGAEPNSLTVSQEKEIISQYQADERSIMLVAEVDDQIVGMTTLAVLDHHRQNHVAEVGICLVKEYWGYGIANILVEEIINFAQHSKLKVLTLEVITENIRAITLYEKFSFSIVGKLSKRTKVNYKYYDTYIMERLL